jgi:capsule biosynthesis phosphatase
MRRLIFDLDGTLTLDQPEVPYSSKTCNSELLERLREYKANGFEIVISTSRSMRTYRSSIGHINAHALPVIIDWLKANDVPFDEIHVGKPWCGDQGFYIDDRAIRPSEFLTLDHAQVLELLAREGQGVLRTPPVVEGEVQCRDE